MEETNNKDFLDYLNKTYGDKDFVFLSANKYDSVEEYNKSQNIHASREISSHNVDLEPIDYEFINRTPSWDYDGVEEGGLSTAELGSDSCVVSKYNDFYEQQFPDHKRTVHKPLKILRYGKEWVENSNTINFKKLSDREKSKYLKRHNDLVWRHNARKKYKEFLYDFVRQCTFKQDYKAYLKTLPWKKRIMLNLSRIMWTNTIVMIRADEMNVNTKPKIKFKMNLWRYIHKFIMKRTEVTVDGYSFLLNTAQFTEPNF